MEPTTQQPPVGLGPYRYNRTAHRYIDARGRFVSWEAVRQALDEALDQTSADLLRAAQRLIDGQITPDAFEAIMRQEIKSAHLASYALQRGGWAQLSQADYGAVGRLLYNPSATSDPSTWGQYQFLDRMMRQVRDGDQPLDGRFLQRVRLYMQAGRKTYDQAQRRMARQLGYDEERFILNPADHCTDADGPLGGCVERARAGWQAVGTFGGVGEMNCRANDRCDVEYRNATTGETWPRRTKSI